MPKTLSRAEEEDALHRRLKAAMRHFRESKGWSQVYMGKLLGLSKATYEKYEGDNPKEKLRKVPLMVAYDFCELSGFSMDAVVRQPAKKRA
jgi:DNA-binding XRE family transcriptional regulator